MRKLNTKNAKQLAIQTIRLLAPYKELVHSITSDNGTEFAEHEYIAEINLKLNNRPRKLLNFNTPNKILFNNFY